MVCNTQLAHTNCVKYQAHLCLVLVTSHLLFDRSRNVEIALHRTSFLFKIGVFDGESHFISSLPFPTLTSIYWNNFILFSINCELCGV